MDKLLLRGLRLEYAFPSYEPVETDGFLEITSQAAVSVDLRFQVHAPARDSNARHGCSLGVVLVMVLPELLRTKWSIPHHSWRR